MSVRTTEKKLPPKTKSLPPRLLVPQVVQTSTMDCGPASLKCLLEGFGIHISYGRLREECQTDLDGTSIDTLEEIANQLGLEAEQVVVPADHVLISEAALLPALAVVRLPAGMTHFVIIWARYGNLVQVMDPAQGRVWKPVSQVLGDLYIHSLPVTASEWREWAGSEEFILVLKQRLDRLKITRAEIEELVEVALADPQWHTLAALDATARMVEKLAASKAIERKNKAGRILKTFFEQVCQESPQSTGELVPANYWSVRPLVAEAEDSDKELHLLLSGAVLIRVKGRRPTTLASTSDTPEETRAEKENRLIAALKENPDRPGRELLSQLAGEDWLFQVGLGLTLVLVAVATVVEGLLFRAILEVNYLLSNNLQRMAALAGLVIFLALTLLLHFGVNLGMLRTGRRWENRLRIAFLTKLGRLPDRYFHSRLVSDLAERIHSLYQIRAVSTVAGRLVGYVVELLITVAGLIWLDPASTPLALLLAGYGLSLPFLPQPFLLESELKVRTHNGALGRFYLDGFLGLLAIQTHRAERSVRREHENLLGEWKNSNYHLQLMKTISDGIQFTIIFGLIGWLVFDHLGHSNSPGNTILYVYWALNIFTIALAIAPLSRQYPTYRNITLRLLETLRASEEETHPNEDSTPSGHSDQGGVSISLNNLTVRAAGHTILENINLKIAAGEHLAIVGASGAGKSSLVGLLLGWHRPAIGELMVNDQPLTGHRLARLREQTAWIDPAVQLWNQSLTQNLYYGLHGQPALALDELIEQSGLGNVVEKLPQRLQTLLGDGGSLLSGGEGQRVRMGRAMMRPATRLVILDEPFRGLDRASRQEYLSRCRKLWREATLLCVTHDIGETRQFERVVVIEGGQILEDGSPAELALQPDSRYRQLLDQEVKVHQKLWGSPLWRRWYLANARLHQPIEKRELRPVGGPVLKETTFEPERSYPVESEWS